MKTLLATLFTLLLCTSTAFAQSVKLSNTTLNGAVTSTAQTVTLASGSASAGATVGAPAVGQILWTADGEAMQIDGINVGGNAAVMHVIRGQFGTRPSAHVTGLVVLTGPRSAFQNADAPAGVVAGGTCTVANIGFQPWVNLTNGNVGLCRSSVWKLTNYGPLTVNSITITP